MNDGKGVLLTGATGALGPSLAAELVVSDPTRVLHVLIRAGAESVQQRFNEWIESVAAEISERRMSDSDWRKRIKPVEGDVGRDGLGMSHAVTDELSRQIDSVVHAAADTQFLSSYDDSWNINTEGTRRAIEFAQTCRDFRRFILVSTVCTSGTRTGRIFEDFCTMPPPFVNNYEQTKWEAEELALASDIPLGIARVSIVMGSYTSGTVHRPGAFHHLLKWFSRGLVPVVPGTQQTLVDLISTEVCAQFIARTLTAPWKTGSIWNLAAGEKGTRLPDLAESVWSHARPGQAVFNLDQPGEPFIVSQETFDRIRQSKTAPRQRVIRGAMDSINSFLPMLLYPRVYDTTAAEQLWGGPLPWPNWRETLSRVMDTCGLTVSPEYEASRQIAAQRRRRVTTELKKAG